MIMCTLFIVAIATSVVRQFKSPSDNAHSIFCWNSIIKCHQLSAIVIKGHQQVSRSVSTLQTVRILEGEHRILILDILYLWFNMEKVEYSTD